jgi:hypothetical protein
VAVPSAHAADVRQLKIKKKKKKQEKKIENRKTGGRQGKE